MIIPRPLPWIAPESTASWSATRSAWSCSDMKTRLPVTMQEMLHHCRAVARGVSRAHLVGDMPFMSYQASISDALRNAGSLLQKGGMDAVKLEGGRERVPAIKAIISAGIPVMGHLGLTPQSVHQLGGWKVQGKSTEAARILIEDALILEDAGCYAIVLESIPAEVGAADFQTASHPGHRDRRGRGLRRPGAGDPRSCWGSSIALLRAL